jgi:hypothetical protein
LGEFDGFFIGVPARYGTVSFFGQRLPLS